MVRLTQLLLGCLFVCFQVAHLRLCNIHFFYLQNFWTMLIIGAFFLIASIVLAATSSGSAFEKAACVSLKILSFILHLNCILISPLLKPHSVCRQEAGQGTDFSALCCFRKRAISELLQTGKQAFLRTSGKLCIFLSSPASLFLT